MYTQDQYLALNPSCLVDKRSKLSQVYFSLSGLIGTVRTSVPLNQSGKQVNEPS